MEEQVKKWVQFSRVPKIQAAIFLVVTAVSALVFGGQTGATGSIALALTITLLADYIFIRLRRIEPFFLSAAVVSGLIIGLLAFPPLPWYFLVLAGVLAMASKSFIKANNRHVFNPAAFGLFFAGLLLNEHVSWWGVIFQKPALDVTAILLFLILIAPGYISAFRLRKMSSILSFLIAFTLLQVLVRFFAHDGLQTIFASTLLSPLVLFFSFVMLPEPMTSPNNSRLQIAYGSFVALAAVAASFLPDNFMPDTLIFGLLLGNLVFYKLRQKYP